MWKLIWGIGIHVSPDGYKIVFDELTAVIREKWPEYPPYTSQRKVLVKWETDALALAAPTEMQLAAEVSQ